MTNSTGGDGGQGAGAGDAATRGPEPFAAIHARLAAKAARRAPGGRLGGSPGEVLARAQRFEGLPPGMKHPKQLLEPLRELGNRRPFSRAALATLTAILDMTPSGPWKKGSDDEHPIVVVSNYELSKRQDVEVRTIQAHLLELSRAGAIVRRPGPSGHRTIRKGADGRLERFGIDLAPLVAFSEALRADLGHARAHRAAMKQAKSDIRLVAVDAAQLRATASMLADICLDREIAGIGVPDAVRAAALAAVEIGNRIADHSEEAYRTLVLDACAGVSEEAANLARMQELKALAALAITDLRTAVFTGLAALPADAWGPEEAGTISSRIKPMATASLQKDSSMDESGFVQTHTRRLTPSIEGYGGATISVGPAGDVRPASEQQELTFDGATGTTKRASVPDLPTVELAVERLLELDPAFPEFLKVATGVEKLEDVRAQDIFDLARHIVIQEFGGSQRIWGDQVGRKGVVVASLAALLTCAKPPGEFAKGSRLAYWLGILRKPHPEINLVPSIFAAHRRARERELEKV